ncbi:MAG TPA: hypothetical protein VNZ52_02505 [Candidatus Thermoplasmatota archaeon]|nr:hypothetical protein [Candidatus Thermoplasmatota archaeon]
MHQQPREMRKAGNVFILFGVAVLLLGLIILVYLARQQDIDYHIVEYGSLGLVGVAMLPLLYVMYRQIAS